jgi:hypothetical protein
MFHTRAVLILGLAAVAACSDQTPTVTTPPGLPASGPPAGAAVSPAAPERLARLFARALQDPAFRAYVKSQLDSSPYQEHKIQLQGFLRANGGRARRDIARVNGIADDEIDREAAAAVPLEVYLPVPAQRAAWRGDDNLFVATAIADRDVPVAFSPDGRRTLLSPDVPPPTPVIAVVPVETDFNAPPPARIICSDPITCGGGSGGGGTPPHGLYMLKSHFVDDFEGWLKGSPEFEIHILGQLGQTDSLKDYACAGEHSSGYAFFDQDANDWTGSVLLFNQTDLDKYKTDHAGQGVRVFALEDDDTPCVIKTDNTTLKHIISTVDSVNRQLTGGRDTTTSAGKLWRAYNILKKIWTFVAGLIKTNDDLIGNAVEDKVVGDFSHVGFNWIVKGDNNVTNGWLDLQMK